MGKGSERPDPPPQQASKALDAIISARHGKPALQIGKQLTVNDLIWISIFLKLRGRKDSRQQVGEPKDSATVAAWRFLLSAASALLTE